MNKWTVILLYPDYIADSFGESYLGYALADGVERAIELVRMECNIEANIEIESLEDLVVIAAFKGEHEDVKPD